MTIAFKDFEEFKNTFSRHGMIVTRTHDQKKKLIEFKIESVKTGISFKREYIMYGLNDIEKITKKFLDFFTKEVVSEANIFNQIVKPFFLSVSNAGS